MGRSIATLAALTCGCSTIIDLGDDRTLAAPGGGEPISSAQGAPGGHGGNTVSTATIGGGGTGGEPRGGGGGQGGVAASVGGSGSGGEPQGGGGSGEGGAGVGGSGGGGAGAGGMGGAGVGGSGGGVVVGDPCNGAPVAWSRHIGSPSIQRAIGVAPSVGGNFLSGHYAGTIDVGGGLQISQGSADVFVARYDAHGEHLWSESFGDANSQTGLQLAPTPGGGVVGAGSFTGIVDFGNGPMQADGEDALAVCFDAAGQLLWAKAFTGPGPQSFRAVSVDVATGNVYLAGLFHNSVDVDGTVHQNGGDADALIVALNSDGDRIWSRAAGGTAHDYANAVAAHGGTVAVGGSVDDDADFGGGVLTSNAVPGVPDAWVAAYDDVGGHLMSRIFGNAEENAVEEMAWRGDDIVVAGRFADQLVVDSFVLDAPYGTFVLVLDKGGVALDAASLPLLWWPEDIAVKASQEILLSAAFFQPVDIGPLSLPWQGAADAVLLTLSTDLAPTAAVTLGSTGDDAITAIAVNDDGSVTASGWFAGPEGQISGCPLYQTAGDADAVVFRTVP